MVYSEVIHEYGLGYYRVVLNFIKISGEDITERLPIIITVPGNRIRDYTYLNRLFTDELKVFVENYFLKGDQIIGGIPKVLEKIEGQDSLIYDLETKLKEANDNIENLRNSLMYVNSIDFIVLVAFDTIVQNTIVNQKLHSDWIGLLSPSMEKNYTLKKGERFIAFSNNKRYIKNLKPNVLWYQATFSDFQETFIDLAIEDLINYKSFVIDFRQFDVPDKKAFIRVNLVINGKSVIQNKLVEYNRHQVNGKTQIYLDLSQVMVDAVKIYHSLH